MALRGLLLVLAVSACRPPSPTPPGSPTEVQGDVETIDLEVVAAGDPSRFTPAESRTLARRAHDAVLELEARPTRRNRPARWRLHALAGELVEYVGNPTPPYFGEVNGIVVNLHDLRNAQLLREDPALLTEHVTPSVELRGESIRWLLDAPADPASVDAEVVLDLLRGSVPH